MRRCTVFCMILLLCSLLFVPVSAQTAEYDGYLVRLSKDAPRLFSRGGLEDFLLVDTLEEALELPEEYVEYIEPNYWIYLFEPVMDGDVPTSAEPEEDAPADPGTGGSTPGESTGEEPTPVPPEEEPEVPVWPNDPLYEEEQWGLQAINGLAACETGYTGGSVLVGMVDSGAHAAHEDLNAANITGENYVGDGLLYSDDIYGHGTVVAGVIAAQTDNGVGVAGIAPDVQLRAYRCFNSKAATVREVIPGILQAIEDGCQVLNLSLGTPHNINAIREAVEAALDAGIVVVAAVGNDGTTTLQYPAAYPGVIGVGAVNTALDVASFSQQNESVFVTAPGEALTGLDYEDAQGYVRGLRGTSYAAPFVTAMAAAALDYDADLTAEGIRYLLQTTSADLGDPGYDTEYGWGLVDLEAFLEELQREFSITYELNGGTLSGRVREHYFVTDQDLALPEAERAGYHFTGWYADEELQQPVEEIHAGSVGDKTFYAGWERLPTISILGDSISTFAGVSNDSAANATLAGSAVYYNAGTQGVYRGDTWWQQTIDLLGMDLLVNNSWSGSCVLATRSGTAGAYQERCVQLHNASGEEPDVIAVFLGTNDFSYYQNTLGDADIAYDALIQEHGDGTASYGQPATTCEAYAIMLHKMRNRYPDAEIYCMTMLPRRNPVYSGSDVGQPTRFNTELEKIITHFGCTVVDLEHCGITSEPENFDRYITDRRVHPGPLGMDRMSLALIQTITGDENAACSITYDLTNVTAKDSGEIVLKGDSYSATLEVAAGFNEIAVSVTMGGKDITHSVWENGTIQIPNVTNPVVITAVAEINDTPNHFRWEMGAQDLVSTGEDNALTRKAGTVASGVINNAYYELQTPVILSHDKPWTVEWSASGNWSGMLLSAKESSAATGNQFLFKTTTSSGFIGFGEPKGSSYENYGIALNAQGIDTAASHIYRIENRIAADGSNQAYLFVDDLAYGPMNHFFVGGNNDQGKTVNWLNGRDFVFSYIGTSGHPINGCKLSYVSVWEGEEPKEPLSLRYDDRYDVSGKTVEILDAGTPTSYQVGYGVAENTVLDTAVVTLKGDTLIATGIGIAVVKIDGVIYEITVETAPISLLLLIGQSNMEGNEGDAKQSIVCPDGQVYATYGDRYDMDITNATHYAPSALTGAYREINAVGAADGLADYPVYMLTDEGAGRKGPDSGFAYEWINQTGEKVWIVNASHGGTSIDVWQPGTTQYEECQAMFGACAETLRKEIAAGHFTLSHMAYFWCQGCNDWGKSAEWYVDKYLSMHDSLKNELAFDHDSNPATKDKTFEFGGIIPVRAGHEWRTCYRTGTYTDTTDQSYYESFMDLQMSGPRVAQYWMGNHPELTDIWNVCTIGEDWVWMPDGTNGVSDYFNKHYTGGRVDYETQILQTDSWYTPTTPKDVHDSIHYNQIGYNEVGREAVRNALILMGINEDYEEETTVTFVDWTGYREADEVFAFAQPQSHTLVVPIVRPITRCKTVNYSLTEGLYYDWYDLTAKTYDTTGTLSAVGAEGVVTVSMQPPGTLFADHLNTLPTQVCRGLNLWPLLEHDPQYYTVNGWGTHDSKQVFSVTVPVQAGDQIWATSMGSNDVNGNTVSTGNGIRVTFFSEYEVLCSMTSNAVYAEFSANGYLTAPEGAVAVNVPMWNNDDSNELYLMSHTHDETAPICSICGKSSHTHSWSAWETVSLPTAEAAGLEQRSCSCGETENREVEGVWQKHALNEHLIPLPESVCCGLNLWSVLEHEEEYYYSGTHWGINESTAVQSITIPVSEGERIFATSFGKAGKNGHPTSNGIRVTFFDAYGVCKTMSPAETYAEFAANGWLTAPAGTIAVNIPVYADAKEIEVYLVAASHNWGGARCVVCGTAHPNLSDYSDKVVSILSASTSTFSGWIPTADGFNLEHRSRYPQDNLLTDVEDTWWHQVIDELGAKLGINDSWAGSQVLNTRDTDSGDLGPKAAMASVTRIQNLGSNGTPDLILFFGAGNDIGRAVPLGVFDPLTAPDKVDLTTVKWDTFSEAYTAAIMRLQHFYPDSRLLVMLYYEMPSYATAEKLNQYVPVIKAICDHYGVEYVDLRGCGITSDMLPDGIHPNAIGMDHITEAVLEKLLSDFEIEAGENTVHTVRHTLSNVSASRSYYKGISHGKPFEEVLSGENLSVTVVMDGVDITEQVYRDGQVRIAAVTGNVEITATGLFNADGHLQKLPETVCSNINLWAELEPENLYYTATGWGLFDNAPNVHSITFPIQEGERIWATSFGDTAMNGNTEPGTRITWFHMDGSVTTVDRYTVHEEFTATGFVTAPKGAIAVNIPSVNGDNTWEVYLLDRLHDYASVLTPPTCEAGGFTTYTCAVCGDSCIKDFTETLEHSFTDYSCYDPEACAEVALCDHGCGATDSRPLHSEPQWTWSPEGMTGEDYGSGRVLLALFDEHHQMLDADFCSSTVYTMVGETVIFRYEPPEFSREVLEKAVYIVRFSLDLADSFAPIMRALTFD